MLPFILLGPLVGALVDRWNRRWVMVVSDGTIALLTALLAYLYWLNVVQVWQVYLVLFLRSLGGTFQDPAMRASTALMVPDTQLTRVNGLNETLQGVVNVVSPPVGALLLAVFSIEATLAIDVVTAVIAITPLLFVRIPHPEVSDSRAPGSWTNSWKPVVRDTIEGFRYLWNWRGLFFLLIVLALVRFFITPPMSLLPLLVTQHFDGGALELGWINSANGFGFVAGGIILRGWYGHGDIRPGAQYSFWARLADHVPADRDGSHHPWADRVHFSVVGPA
jgi:DHA3 family macrolide efflux protein-like MFS transporter